MALQLGALRDALEEAGASDAMARAAAEEVAAYENRLVGIEQRLAELRAYVDQRFSANEAELRLHRLATVIAFQVAIFIKLFAH